ncbi:HNH endonuclease [Escherichia phage TR1]|uniref:HNH-endonuclease n=1 Tax=Escherichia phage vB_EcoS_IME542 TaxID=2507711 RepID=A0A410T5X2_9CAUD|nr:HNH endonuclease [Nitratidesulfovibrio liaohensis]YP_009824873.1 HNH endonuclease [Escherichia phage vB_EcoS_IME542]NHZ46740.1 HNH endonuclease [Nitratidesulfovibrio liaohensis]QAU04374.1 HNH-endonuclease [Escherichia phage vB_EcoS_IME542]UVD31762.1 HNH endonuclease [Escherichia phage TR1]
MNWHDYFYYVDGKLHWKISTARRVKVGDECNSLSTSGYYKVSVNGFRTYVHRVVWEMFNGELQNGDYIDHINHNKLDNRIENLRVTTNQGNSRNCKLSVLSTNGYCGVAKLNHGKFKAHIKVDGKHLHLGNFDTPEQAYKVRIEAERKYNFHENHGLSK